MFSTYFDRYHNSQMINHLPGLSVSTSPTRSTLSLPSVTPLASGNYTCSPHLATAASAVVHVIDENDDNSNNAAAVKNTNDAGDDGIVNLMLDMGDTNSASKMSSKYFLSFGTLLLIFTH